MKDYAEYYKKRKLLADGKTNAKMAKNSMKTYGLSLIPHKLNSKAENLCKFSTRECRNACLNTSGHGKFSNVQIARKQKTDYFVEQKDAFIKQLYSELKAIDAKGQAAIRLNVVSDVDWEAEMQERGLSLKDFKNIIFYGYTKNPFMIESNDNPNYHFTFSFSGGNWVWCEKFLKERKANVAVVFEHEPPNNYLGWKVIDGVSSDERYLDEKGVIVGLKYKKPKDVIDLSQSKFIIRN